MDIDNGTLLLNDISYSGNGGTLVVNGISYSGGALENAYSKFASGNVNNSTSGRVTVDVGFRPRLIIAIQSTTAGVPSAMNIYDENLGNFVTRNTSDVRDLPNTADNRMGDVTDTGFVMNRISNGTTIPRTYYWAFG